MAQLHNRVSRKELKEKMQKDRTPRTTISFYRYFKIDDPVAFRNELYQSFKAVQVFGRIYIASEGINAQISVPTSLLENFTLILEATQGLKGLRLNIAVDEGDSFFVLDIKVRKKIVADGIEDPDFSMDKKGKYVDAAGFNALTDSKDTIVIDMRNHYEYEVGHFKGAIEIPSDTFREQLPMAADMMEEHKDKNIIMYCTGGIRCEKASAYLLHQGFENVYHLEGGIINYVNQVQSSELPNKFIGKNFVFDQRLGERVTEDIIARCHQCGTPADTHTNCVNDACHLLFIQCDTCKAQWENCCSKACRDFIHLPEEEQKERRMGMDLGRNIFNKAKIRKPLMDI
jgi:UPF0176 protein